MENNKIQKRPLEVNDENVDNNVVITDTTNKKDDLSCEESSLNLSFIRDFNEEKCSNADDFKNNLQSEEKTSNMTTKTVDNFIDKMTALSVISQAKENTVKKEEILQESKVEEDNSESNTSGFVDETVLFCSNKPEINCNLTAIDNYLDERYSIENNIVDDESEYFKLILKMFNKIDGMLDNMNNKETVEKSILQQCYKYAYVNKNKHLMMILKEYKVDITRNDIIVDFCYNAVDSQIDEIKIDLYNVLKQCSKYKEQTSKIFRFLDEYKEKTEIENGKVKKLLRNSEESQKKLVQDASKLKERLICILAEEIGEERIQDINLEVEITDELVKVLKIKNEALLHQKNKIEMLTNQEKQLKGEVKKLLMKYEEMARNGDRTISLQNENIDLSEKLNKMTEQHIQQQKKLVKYQAECQRLLASDESKTRTILRQRKLFDLLQTQLFDLKKDEGNVALHNLKEQWSILNKKIQMTTNEDEKFILIQKRRECERRIDKMMEQ